MKNKMRTSKKLFAIVLTAIMVLSVCAVLPAMGDEPAPTVTRTIFKDIYPTTTAYPGDVLIVVIEFVAPQNIPNAGVYDSLIDSGDWNTSVRSIIPGESFNFTSPADNPYIFVWWTGDNSLKEDDPVSVKYQLTVPEDAAGVYYFDGNLSTHSVWPPIDIGGDGSVTVTTEDTEPPIVTNPDADPYIIPEDTDNEPLWGELSNLSVVVTDDSEVTSVTINLSSIGGSAVQTMNRIGSSNVWNVSTNASIDSAIFEAGSYEPHLLQVNATDEHGYSNPSESIELMVMENGDVSGNGEVTMYDSYYLAMWDLDKLGFEEIVEEVADVSGNSEVTMYDSYYLAMWDLDKPSFEKLK
jgi:hypothetical protein